MNKYYSVTFQAVVTLEAVVQASNKAEALNKAKLQDWDESPVLRSYKSRPINYKVINDGAPVEED